jgi:iron(III) transport system permease protein
VVGAVLATATAFIPLVYLVVRATEDGWQAFVDTLWRSSTAELTVNSIRLALVVTACSMVLGVGLAWLVTRTDLPGRSGFQLAFALPLALPSYVAAYAWIGWNADLAGFVGSALVLTTVSYPFVYLPVLAALRRADPALEDAARCLGHGPAMVLWRVTLPQVRPAAVGGALLVGLYVLSDFGAVAIMRYDALTRAIYNSYRSSFDRTPAAVLGVVLAVLAIVVVVIESRMRARRGPIARVGGGARRAHPQLRLGRWTPLGVVISLAVLVVTLGVPAWGLARWFRDGTSTTDWSAFAAAASNTLQVSALGALAVVALAFPVALLTVRHPGLWSRTATRAAYAGHALPGVVVGLSLVFFGIQVVPNLYQEIPLLVLGYVVLYLSLGLGAVEAGIAQIPPVLEDVARTLGRNRWQVWWGVTARLAAPGLGAAATLVFLTVMKELPATLFLRPTGFETLATELWSNLSGLSRAAAAPYAAAIVLLAALPTALLATVGDQRRRR